MRQSAATEAVLVEFHALPVNRKPGEYWTVLVTSLAVLFLRAAPSVAVADKLLLA